MPHFFAKKLDSIALPQCTKHFKFILEARNLKDKSALILVESLQNNTQKILLNKQEKNGKFLIKFNKHFKVHSKELIKSALRDYANLANADILSHNLNAGNIDVDSRFLLDFRGILNILPHNNANLEIGFGSGRHILNLAQNNPQSIIIGLEIYRPAILQVLRQIEILGLKNLFIANIDARTLCEILPNATLDRIFLHFPVPWDKNPQRRVFSEYFLQNIIRILKKDGFFELVTDSKEYFCFAKKLAKNYHCKTAINAPNAVVSKYEARWQREQKTIYKLQIFPQMKAFSRICDVFCKKNNDISRKKNSNIKGDLSQEFSEILSQWKAKFNANFISKILALKSPKICQKECFLHIKDVYEFDSGFVIFVAFGAYYAPSSAFFVIANNKVECLSDIIYTKANITAMRLVTEF